MATIFCMNCGAELDERARFCTECGSPTLLGAGLIEEQGKAQIACPTCGTLNDSGARRCVRCGGRLSKLRWSSQLPRSEAHTHYAEAAKTSEATRTRTLVIGGIAAAAVVGVIVGGLLASGVFGEGSSASQPAQVVTGLTGTVKDGDEEGTDGQAVGLAGVEVKADLADYSWQELSIIGKEMSRKGSRESALELAQEYNLVDESGSMTNSTKSIELIGIGSVKVRLLDVYHDNLANGEGKAGLTFMAAEIPFTHFMNATNDNTGGWEGSELRSWLNTTIYSALSEELRTAIVAVDKRSNNVGNSHDPSCVSSTIDLLWLPSMVEVAGPIDWTWPSDPDNSDGYNAIANAEGSQYAVFAEIGVETIADNPDIVLSSAQGPTTYWERSCTSSNTLKFRAVGADGDPATTMEASNEFGVCPCFCL